MRTVGFVRFAGIPADFFSPSWRTSECGFRTRTGDSAKRCALSRNMGVNRLDLHKGILERAARLSALSREQFRLGNKTTGDWCWIAGTPSR